MNVSASLTKSIFHCGKAGRRSAFIAASTKRMRASMALSRNQMTCQATERQATFPGKTEPRAARPEGPVAGVDSRAARACDCQHKRFCIARRPHCRRSKRAIASNHEGEWRILHRAPRRAGRRRHAASGLLSLMDYLNRLRALYARWIDWARAMADAKESTRRRSDEVRPKNGMTTTTAKPPRRP